MIKLGTHEKGRKEVGGGRWKADPSFGRQCSDLGRTAFNSPHTALGVLWSSGRAQERGVATMQGRVMPTSCQTRAKEPRKNRLMCLPLKSFFFFLLHSFGRCETFGLRAQLPMQCECEEHLLDSNSKRRSTLHLYFFISSSSSSRCTFVASFDPLPQPSL